MSIEIGSTWGRLDCRAVCAAAPALSVLVWLGAWWCERRDIRGGVRGMTAELLVRLRELDEQAQRLRREVTR